MAQYLNSEAIKSWENTTLCLEKSLLARGFSKEFLLRCSMDDDEAETIQFVIPSSNTSDFVPS